MVISVVDMQPEKHVQVRVQFIAAVKRFKRMNVT